MRKPLRPYDRTSHWRRVKAQVIARDGGVCRLRLPGCTIQATTADHIIPWLQGGGWYDLSNLRAACDHCNKVRGGQTQRNPRKPKPSREW